MNLKDILDLAKAGYKPSDVKELIALADAHEKEREEKTEEKPEDDQEEKPEEEPEEKPEEKPEDAEITELKKQVKKLQEDNTRKDVSSELKDDADILADFVRGFM